MLVSGEKTTTACGAVLLVQAAQILIVEANNIVRKLIVSSVELVGMGSPLQLSIIVGLITAQFAACWFTKDPCYEICRFS